MARDSFLNRNESNPVFMNRIVRMLELRLTALSDTVTALHATAVDNLFTSDLTLASGDDREHIIDADFFIGGEGSWGIEFDDTVGGGSAGLSLEGQDAGLNTQSGDNAFGVIDSSGLPGGGNRTRVRLYTENVLGGKAGFESYAVSDNTSHVRVLDGQGLADRTVRDVMTLQDASTGEVRFEPPTELIIDSAVSPSFAVGTAEGAEVVSTTSGARYRSTGAALSQVTFPSGFSTVSANLELVPATVTINTNKTSAIAVPAGTTFVVDVDFTDLNESEICVITFTCQDGSTPSIVQFSDRFTNSAGELLEDKVIDYRLITSGVIGGGSGLTLAFIVSNGVLREITHEVPNQRSVTTDLYTWKSNGVNQIEDGFTLNATTQLIHNAVYTLDVITFGETMGIASGTDVRYVPLGRQAAVTLTNTTIEITRGRYEIVKDINDDYDVRKISTPYSQPEFARISATPGAIGDRTYGDRTTLYVGDNTVAAVNIPFELNEFNDIREYDLRVVGDLMGALTVSWLSDDTTNIAVDVNGAITNPVSSLDISTGTHYKVIIDGTPGAKFITIMQIT